MSLYGSCIKLFLSDETCNHVPLSANVILSHLVQVDASNMNIKQLVQDETNQPYILSCCHGQVHVVLARDIASVDSVRAFVHAQILRRTLGSSQPLQKQVHIFPCALHIFNQFECIANPESSVVVHCLLFCNQMQAVISCNTTCCG